MNKLVNLTINDEDLLDFYLESNKQHKSILLNAMSLEDSKELLSNSKKVILTYVYEVLRSYKNSNATQEDDGTNTWFLFGSYIENYDSSNLVYAINYDTHKVKYDNKLVSFIANKFLTSEKDSEEVIVEALKNIGSEFEDYCVEKIKVNAYY